MSNKWRFKCQGFSHIATDSPNRRVITLVEWEANKEDEVEEEQEENDGDEQEDGQEEVLEEVDQGKMLVLQRVLSNQKGVKDRQREHIFHSRCIVQGKM